MGKTIVPPPLRQIVSVSANQIRNFIAGKPINPNNKKTIDWIAFIVPPVVSSPQQTVTIIFKQKWLQQYYPTNNYGGAGSSYDGGMERDSFLCVQ